MAGLDPIDTHCHLEQPDYDKDRDEVVALCRQNMSAIITNAPEPQHFEVAFEITEKYPGFVFAVVGIHPQYAAGFRSQAVDEAVHLIRKNKHRLVGLGETGLDYSWVQSSGGREQQRKLFIRFIGLGKELGLPISIHLRNGEDREEADVFDYAFQILREQDAERVHLHMFGSKQHINEAMDLGCYVSMNNIVLHSKTYAKVVRDTPIERLMLETDAPWLHPSLDNRKRNDPTHVLEVAEKIAEIKHISLEQVIQTTSQNAIEFFDLKLNTHIS